MSDTGSSTLEDLTSAGGVMIGAAACVLEDLTSAGGVIIGAAACVLEDLTSDTQAGSYEGIFGYSNTYLLNTTSSGAGLSFEPPAGSSTITLEALESAGTGHHRFGTSAAILEALAGSGVGAYLVTGLGSGALVGLESFGFGTSHRARRVRQIALIGSTRATVTLNATVR